MKRRIAAVTVLALGLSLGLASLVSAHAAKLCAPRGLTAVVAPGQVTLTWQAVTETCYPAGAAPAGVRYAVDNRDVPVGTTTATSYVVVLPVGWTTLHVYAQASGLRTSPRAWVTVDVTQGGGSPVPTPTPTPRPTSTPTPTPTSTPTPSATPKPSSTPTPTPNSSACPAPLSGSQFPVGFFAPGFVGPVMRTFNEQFITDEGSYLRTCYPAGSTAPSSGHPGGAQAKLSIAAGPALSYTLTYQVRFPVGFQWVKGGKMPGLCGGGCWTGSENGPGGWSTRFMWRANGVAEVLLSDATTTGYGTDLFRYSGNWNWQADGQWHTISQTVAMNTPGAANGTIAVSYDGRQVAQATGITFRAAGDTDEIDSLMFTTFFGGHTSSWAPTATQTIDWRAFAVS